MIGLASWDTEHSVFLLMLDPHRLSEKQGGVLVDLARESLEAELGQGSVRPRGIQWLEERGASFVTLMLDGRLRGCIGSLEACRSIGVDVGRNAVAAGFKDWRFPPVTAKELAKLVIEVSVLSPVERLEVDSEKELLEILKPGADGLLLESGSHRATFLPQVWDQLPEPGLFLAQLRKKAGLPPDHWSSDLCLSRYSVRKFRER